MGRASFDSPGVADACEVVATVFTLKNAVQPRMDADGHGSQAFAATHRSTRWVNKKRRSKSVFIHVHPWLINDSFVRFQLRNLAESM
jgi:hypothetical protein